MVEWRFAKYQIWMIVLLIHGAKNRIGGNGEMAILEEYRIWVVVFFDPWGKETSGGMAILEKYRNWVVVFLIHGAKK